MIHVVDISDYLSNTHFVFFFLSFSLLYAVVWPLIRFLSWHFCCFAINHLCYETTHRRIVFAFIFIAFIIIIIIQYVRSGLADVIYFGYCFIFWRVQAL